MVLHEQDFRARFAPSLSSVRHRMPPALRRAAGFAEKRCCLPPNPKLLINIRISTEDEINGTVKGVV
jgi:hypothetical protein